MKLRKVNKLSPKASGKQFYRAIHIGLPSPFISIRDSSSLVQLTRTVRRSCDETILNLLGNTHVIESYLARELVVELPPDFVPIVYRICSIKNVISIDGGA